MPDASQYTITFEGPHGKPLTLGSVDDLEAYGGNLYIYVDGKEYGSLWFTTTEEGTPKIVLGQFDHDTEQWEQRNPLTKPFEQDPLVVQESKPLGAIVQSLDIHEED